MKIMILDTETINVLKPFCYNIGYVIYDIDAKQVLLKREIVIEQVWHNKMLFETAYYENKRPLYYSALKGKRAKLQKFGNALRTLKSDIKKYGVEFVSAYNNKFDLRVFKFNCDYYGLENPLENIKGCDIWKLAKSYITNTQEYIDFANENNYLSDIGNIKTSAEIVYRFIKNDKDFIEDHIALSDSLIELEILKYIIELKGWGVITSTE